MPHLRPSGLVVALTLGGGIAVACAGARGETVPPPFEVVAEFPHDTAAYTQGLVWDNGTVLESTGRYGQSELRRVELATGKVLQSVPLAGNRFGEGLARVGDRLYLLTWESKVGYVFDARTLAPVDSFTYEGEGWGLATDGASLFMSDGSDSLRVLDPRTRRVTRIVKVRQDGSPLSKLNELEYVNGELYANVYESDWVARIDPASGAVQEMIDLAELFPKARRTARMDVMNGIAVGPTPGTFLLTGKLWPTMYQVRFRPRVTR